MNELVNVSGDFTPIEYVLVLSLNTALFAIVLLPRMVMSPRTVVAPPAIVPDVSMTVAPPIEEFPLIVLVVIVELMTVLLDMDSVASRVTTTPLDGNTAVEF